jgi:chromosomal replication initiator protein
MSDLVEARDIDGHLYIPAYSLAEALARARKNGAEHERVRLLSMMTPAERRKIHVMEVCSEAGVSLQDVMGSSRLANICRVRQRLFYDFRKDGMSLPEIGRFFGRDHTTVLHGINAEKERQNGMGNKVKLPQAVEAA